MKKKIYSLLTFLALLFSFKATSQCNFINPSVKLNYTQTAVAGGCLINIDLSFDLAHNDGNKWVNIHLWTTAQYPGLTYSTPPTAAQLSNTVANIVIDQRSNPVVLSATYPPSAGVVVQSTGLTVTKVTGATFDRYTITNISLLTTTPCSISQSFTGDAWSSQGNGDNVVHCSSTGFTFLANDPEVLGFLFCPRPRQYSVTISTNAIAPGVSGTYNVYRDDDDNGLLNTLTDPIVATNIPWSAVSGTPFNSGIQSYTGNNTPPTSNKSLFVVVSTVGLSNTIFYRIYNSCIPLPVNFKSFTAARNQSSVQLKWETVSEVNNKGFAIERNINGIWEQITFIPTQAINGNSDQLLNYQYTDLNNTKGITQYRIKQVDVDSRFLLSEIRAVRGNGQVGKTIIYPNPTIDGKINILFEEAAVSRDISLIDMSGRIVKQWHSMINNNLTIENLAPGMYSLRIYIPATGVQSTEKIVVNKR